MAHGSHHRSHGHHGGGLAVSALLMALPGNPGFWLACFGLFILL